jgi:integrase
MLRASAQKKTESASASRCTWTSKRAGEDTELSFRAHARRWRRSFAAELLSCGVPVSEVAAILGNSPRVVEQTYSQFIVQRKEAIDRAIEMTWK